MRYSDVETWIAAGLKAKGYGTTGKPMPVLNPGPPTIQGLWKVSPNALVFATVGNGAGLTKEGLFERVFLVLRVIGSQHDYGYAETLAYDLDDLCIAVDSNTNVGTALVLFMTRTSGAPQLVDYDSSERYHFQTTYIVEAKR